MESIGVGVISMIVGINYRRITLMVSSMSMPQSMDFLPLLSSGRIHSTGGSASEQEETKDD
jgi:hypothetical protein